MNQFKEVESNNQSLSQRKLVYGKGVNDALYHVGTTVNNKYIICPYYTKWRSMIQRCYSINYQKKQPTYIGCVVCAEWLSFSNFKAWMVTQDWKGKQLDKDILNQGNKIYSPDNCMFVPQEVNKLFNDQSAKRGEYPTGVYWHFRDKNFMSYIRVNGKLKHLGRFASAELASKAYVKEKYALIKVIAKEQCEPLKTALLSYRL